MNQILAIDNKKKNKKVKRSSTNIEIKNIVMFFAIAIIVFGLFLIGHSSYAIYVDARGNSTENLPTINISRVNDTLIVEVQSVNVIERFKYNWQNSEQRSIPESSNNFQEEITLPSSNNVLTIILEDETGRAVTYTKEIILDGIDIVKPTISIDKQSAGVRVEAVDETAIDYIIYRIDDGEEIRVDKNNENDTSIQYAITDIGRGEHTIYVTAVDQAGNTSTAEQAIIVSSATPEITELNIDRENGLLIIGVSDVDGIQSIEVNLNGSVHFMDDINLTEARFSLSLVDGTNTISIKITNVNGLTAEGATEFEY